MDTIQAPLSLLCLTLPLKLISSTRCSSQKAPSKAFLLAISFSRHLSLVSCFSNFCLEPSMANYSKLQIILTPNSCTSIPLPCFIFITILLSIYSLLVYLVYGQFSFLECKFHEAVLFCALSPVPNTCLACHLFLSKLMCKC